MTRSKFMATSESEISSLA